MLTVLTGDWIEQLREIPAASAQTCVTSPPYWSLRDYKHSGQLGLEKTPEEYVSKLVAGFREVWRVLKDDATLWLVIGDSYAGAGYSNHKNTGGAQRADGGKQKHTLFRAGAGRADGIVDERCQRNRNGIGAVNGCKAKDLVGIPWMTAFALRADGWYLRSDVIWAKPNAMPESVTDRPTRSHEYIFLLTKGRKYYYNHEAIKEPASESSIARISRANFDNQHGGEKDYANGVNGNRSMRKALENWAEKQRGHGRRHDGFNDRWDKMERAEQCSGTRNKRDVWTVAPANYRDAHFATFPPKLVEPCILAGSRPGDTVLDPFGGSGTTAEVAISHGRKALIIELNPEYIPMIHARCEGPLAQRRQQTLF